MKSSLQNFLTDLYQIDPSLKSHEAEIVPLVEKLLRSDPAQAPDAAFVSRLRMQLQNRAAELSDSPSSVWSKILYAFGGAVTAAVVLPLAFVAYNQSEKAGTPTDGSSALFGYSVTEEGSRAFGDLDSMTAGQSAEMSRSQSGGGGQDPAPSMAMSPIFTPPSYGTDNAAVTEPAMDAKMMIAPWPMTEYDYVYEGDIKDLESSVSVFRRNPSSKSVSLASLGSAFNLGTIDLGSFAGMNLDSATFSQNRPYGYQITVNLRDSSVYLDAQWDQWPQSKCQTEACWQAQRVKISDVPADDVLLGIAKSFVDAHGIDLSQYGEPVVDNAWKRDYERAVSPDQAYVPDQIRVIYPLQVDGKDVYDQSGMKTGVSIGVQIKERKVINVYGLMGRSYEKSAYEGVTDQAVIKDYLSKIDNYYGGGVMPMERVMAPGTPGNTQQIQTVTVVLGEPVVSFVQYYRYDKAISEELLVPSLVFRVKEVKGGDAGMYYRSNVVVPLAKEMLELQQPIMMPMEGDVRAM